VQDVNTDVIALYVSSSSSRTQTDTQTDRQTDKETDGRTDVRCYWYEIALMHPVTDDQITPTTAHDTLHCTVHRLVNAPFEIFAADVQ